MLQHTHIYSWCSITLPQNNAKAQGIRKHCRLCEEKKQPSNTHINILNLTTKLFVRRKYPWYTNNPCSNALLVSSVTFSNYFRHYLVYGEKRGQSKIKCLALPDSFSLCPSPLLADITDPLHLGPCDLFHDPQCGVWRTCAFSQGRRTTSSQNGAMKKKRFLPPKHNQRDKFKKLYATGSLTNTTTHCCLKNASNTSKLSPTRWLHLAGRE